ncbi:MAG: hypothetical protein JWP04_2816 [Belnapia sp.]|nr:hypothetical protein [Belnapia sp.]
MDQTLIAGRYEIRDLPGPGIGGTAFVATDRRLGRPVALKLIGRPGIGRPGIERPGPADATAEEVLHRALREARIAGRLSHPNILAVLDTGHCPDYAWIAHELPGGESLEAALERDGPAASAEAARIMDEILDALETVHVRGIVHGALQPGNILLADAPAHAWNGAAGPRFGQARLTDFGLARLGQSGWQPLGPIPGLLPPGAIPAPEQLRGEPGDHRADIWAAGILFHQLLTGAKPLAGPPVVPADLAEDPPAIDRPGLPAGFARIIARALATRPEDRFPDAESMAAAIRVAALPPATAIPCRYQPQGHPLGPTPGLIGFLRRKRA